MGSLSDCWRSLPLLSFQMEAVVESEAWPIQSTPPGEACTRAFLAEDSAGVWASCEALLRGILDFEHK